MSDRERTTKRQARIETLEERVVLSAQPFAEITPETMVVDSIEPTVEQLAPNIAEAHAATGHDHVFNQYGFKGDGQTVAVIDTGIAWDHYALGGGFGADYRVVGGWDFAENDANPYDDGPAGFHGTHVAGIIGSSDTDHQGVASGADLVSLRVFDDMGRATFEWVEQALQWVHENKDAFENPITTVNLSLGVQWNSDSVPDWAILEDEFSQLKADGIFIAVAAGNSFGSFGSEGLSYPAVSPHVVPVASVGADGQLSDFSQRNDRIIAAPGESIASTIPNHIYGSEQPSDKFLALSGTSMATPYLAGASVLVREAMGVAGYENVNQDVLYEHFRQTADEIWDHSTQSSYFRLNLQRAIDSIVIDQIGKEVDSTQDLGLLNDEQSIDDSIESNSETDRYSFTAASNGQVSLSLTAGSGFTPHWELPESAQVSAAGVVTFDVVEGDRYEFGLGTSGEIGHYSIAVALVAQALPNTIHDLGVVFDHSLSGIEPNDSQLYQATAGRDGYFTAVADFGTNHGRIQLLDQQQNVIAETASLQGRVQLDHNVANGEQLFVRVSGESSTTANLRLLNLVSQSGDGVKIVGTEADDQFEITVEGDLEVAVNGASYKFEADSVSQLRIVGREGTDRIQFIGNELNDSVRLRGDFIKIENSAIQIVGHHLESTSFDLGGGHDRVVLMHDGIDQTVTVTHQGAQVQTDRYQHQVTGVEFVRAFGGQGTDSALLHAEHHGDRLVAGHYRSSLFSSHFEAHLIGFDDVHAIAAGGTNATAYMNGTSGDDAFEISDGRTKLDAASSQVLAEGFDRTFIRGRGGQDTVNWTRNASSSNLVQESSGRATIEDAGYRYFVQRGIEVRVADAEPSSIQSAYFKANNTSYVSNPERSESTVNIDVVHAQFARSAFDTNRNDSLVSEPIHHEYGSVSTTGRLAAAEASRQSVGFVTSDGNQFLKPAVSTEAIIDVANTSEQVRWVDREFSSHDLSDVPERMREGEVMDAQVPVDAEEELDELDSFFEQLSQQLNERTSPPSA